MQASSYQCLCGPFAVIRKVSKCIRCDEMRTLDDGSQYE